MERPHEKVSVAQSTPVAVTLYFTGGSLLVGESVSGGGIAGERGLKTKRPDTRMMFSNVATVKGLHLGCNARA